MVVIHGIINIMDRELSYEGSLDRRTLVIASIKVISKRMALYLNMRRKLEIHFVISNPIRGLDRP
jgi:hypothetical protein